MNSTITLFILMFLINIFETYSQNAHVEKLKENTLKKLNYLHNNHPGVLGYYVVHPESGETFSHQKDMLFATLQTATRQIKFIMKITF